MSTAPSLRVFHPINPWQIESRHLPLKVGALVWTHDDKLYTLPRGLASRTKVRLMSMGASGGQLVSVRTLANDPQGPGRIFILPRWQLDAGKEYRHPADPQWRAEWTDEGRALIQIHIAHLFSTHRENQTFDNSDAIERCSWHLIRDWSDPEVAQS